MDQLLLGLQYSTLKMMSNWSIRCRNNIRVLRLHKGKWYWNIDIQIKEKAHRKTPQWNAHSCIYISFTTTLPSICPHLFVFPKMIDKKNTKCKPWAILNQPCHPPKRTKAKKKTKGSPRVHKINSISTTIWDGNIKYKELLNLRRGLSWTCREVSSSLR